MVECWQPPELEKGVPCPGRENRLLSVGFFISLQAWARWIVTETGCAVYLVGSALTKRCPRDVDVALIWPDDQYAVQFGPIPRSMEEYHARWNGPFRHAAHSFVISAWNGVGYVPRIDVHLFPRCWWPEKPRLPLDGSIPPERMPFIEPFYLSTMIGDNCPEKPLFEWRGEGVPCLGPAAS